MNALRTITGTVIEGKKRGRTLGYPTINIKLNQHIESGIYASRVYVGTDEHIAATFIGDAKTFNENDYKLESYILDFDKEIYGKEVTVKLYKKLRNNEKYENVEELIKQIEKDIVDTRNYFTSPRSL